ncbi:glycoside hydrolase family 25 protein [Hongsoonwoonella zoysiae]|uniref:glycoside hydrolase family 25 protein n=1 Tax=Hongsoonwoonella zoysiae TaxID=2821844 RepID=UPI001FEC7405|nr:GH25 family lysozyme [Hongsoonwoonella zoysiae]
MDIVGIDVSHHLGEIDWDAVKADGVAFAFIKATEGADFRDPRFAENWQGSRLAGVPRGPYHVFSFGSTGSAQAENFIDVVPTAISATMPPALDLEIPRGHSDLLGRDEVLSEVLDWLQRIEENFTRAAIIYTDPAFFARYLEGSAIAEGADGRKFWLRSIGERPAYGPDWTIWQFDDKGQVAGIDKPVDKNCLRKKEILSDILQL